MGHNISIKISNKVFQKHDLQRLAAIFTEENVRDPNMLEFSIHYEDGTSIEENHSGVFDLDLLEIKKVTKISMSYYNRDFTNRMYLDIEVSDLTWKNNKAVVKSDNEDWYLRVTKKLESILATINGQCVVNRLFTSASSVFIMGGVFLILSMFVTRLILKLSTNTPAGLSDAIMIISGFLGFGFPIVLLLAYPNIEFDFGKNVTAKRCKTIIKFLIGFLLLNNLWPIFISRIF